MQFYLNSRKESGAAFGPGRQAALATHSPTHAQEKLSSVSGELDRTQLTPELSRTAAGE